MALATRPKPSVHHKKRQAGHHRYSKHYLKAYHPYLPMLAIVGLGVLINLAWSSLQNSGTSQYTTRIQIVTGDTSSLSLYVLFAICGLAAFWLATRHGLRLKRYLAKGETFIAHHPLLDIAAVAVITTGFVLSQTIGIR